MRRNWIFANIGAWKPTTFIINELFHKESSKDSDQSFSYIVRFLKIFKNTPIFWTFFMTASEIRTKTNEKYSSKVNIKYKSQTLLFSSPVRNFIHFNVFILSSLSSQQFMTKIQLPASENIFVLLENRFVLRWFLLQWFHFVSRY